MEFALAMPLLVVLLLGMITSALTLNDDMQLTHATREGARYGATIPDDQTFATGTWAENVRDIVLDRFAGDLTASDVCVALVTASPPVPLSVGHTTKGDGSACYDDSSAGIIDARVQITGSTDAVIDTGFYTFEFTVRSEATAKHESNG